MKQKFRPLGSLVLAKRLDPIQEDRGIIIPQQAQELPNEALVVSIGSGVSPSLKVGDKILFGKYSGSKVVVGGKEFLLLREEEVLGILEEIEEVVH